MGAYQGQRVVISGGSSGIGRAAALEVARGGGSVAVLARGQAALDETLAALRAANPAGEHLAVSVDVGSEEAVSRAAQEILAAFGHVDLLVLNQGYARCAPATEAGLDAYTSLMDTNFFGHVRLVKAFLPSMQARGRGTVGLVTSMLGFMSFYGYSGYAASKFAIVGFAEALRQEALPYGVHVCVFFPPTTDTPGLEAENETKPALTWAIEGSSRKFSPEDVARVMLAGFARHRFTNMIGVDSWAIFWLSRLAPGLVRWVIDRELWGYVKKHGMPGLPSAK